MLHPRAITLLMFFSLAGTAHPAHPPSKAEAAKAHYVKGVQLYKQADYASAWLQFTSAYQLLPRPELLFNMARCEAKLGRPADALDHYQTYLSAVPNDPDAGHIRREIATLKAEVERQQRRLDDEARKATKAEAERPPEGRRKPPFPLYGTIAGGGTLLCAIIGSALLGSVDAQYNALKTDCGPNCLPERVQPLEQQATAGYVFMGLAAAGAVTTAALLTWELRRRPRELRLSWRF